MSQYLKIYEGEQLQNWDRLKSQVLFSASLACEERYAEDAALPLAG